MEYVTLYHEGKPAGLPGINSLLEDIRVPSQDSASVWSHSVMESAGGVHMYGGGHQELHNGAADVLGLASIGQSLDEFPESWPLCWRQDECYDQHMAGTLEDTKAKIEVACAALKIPNDPEKWTVKQVHDWLKYSCMNSLGLPPSIIREQDWMVTGSQLCRMTLRDFEDRIQHEGDYLRSELELWKSTQCGDLSESISSLSMLLSDDLLNEDDVINYEVLGNMTSLGAQLDRFSPLPLQSSVDHHHQQRLTTMTSQLVSDPNLQMTTESICRGTTIMVPFERKTSPYWESGEAMVCDRVKAEVVSEENQSVDAWGMAHSTVISTSVLFQDEAKPKYSNKGKWTNMSTTPTPNNRRGKRTICLWQFLKELLLVPQYQPWIRWVDRNRGIFKIEDSVRVAKMWGERKNRPAMNYDKLSRSIRQYYKKGIIQKCTQSKRLVYQFCTGYL